MNGVQTDPDGHRSVWRPAGFTLNLALADMGWRVLILMLTALPICRLLAAGSAAERSAPPLARPASLPQPIAVWLANPLELQIVFDRRIGLPAISRLKTSPIQILPSAATSDFGTHTSAQPPIHAPELGSAATGTLHIVSARLASDRRTLELSTDPHPLYARYELMLPAIRCAERGSAFGSVRVEYTLSGVEAAWTPAKQTKPVWVGWLPDLDLTSCEARLGQSPPHAPLFSLWQRAGTLRLDTQLKPDGIATALRLEATTPFRVEYEGRQFKSQQQPRAAGLPNAANVETGPQEILELDIPPVGAPLSIELATGAAGGKPKLEGTWIGTGRAAARLQPRELLLPWAPVPSADPIPAQPAPSLVGGSVERGHDLFVGNLLKCAACHSIRGQGGAVGPDLSSIYQRSPESVYRDILAPSDRLNPDYVAFNLTLREGLDLQGLLRTVSDRTLQIIETDGKSSVLKRADILNLRPSALSLMPSGLLDPLTPEQVRDLLTFLLHSPEKSG